MLRKNELKEIETFCRKLSKKAGEVIMRVYNDTALSEDVKYKVDNSPLTLADKKANEIIVKTLKNEFPMYAILSEEEKDDEKRLLNPMCFIVDPLDGTKEFIKRNGQFTVNIALTENGKSIMGVVYVPVSGDVYFASHENGSFYCNSKGDIQRIYVSNEQELSKVRLVMSSSHGSSEMNDIIKKYGFTNFVKMGSSLKGCLVAKGDAEIYYRHGPTMEWDTAAMQCIIEQAGGIFRQMDGSIMTYNRKNSLNDKGFFAINCSKNILHDIEVNLNEVIS